MSNMRTVTAHISERLQREQDQARRRWEVPQIIPTQEGEDYTFDSGGAFWRAMSFIEAARPYETVQNIEHAREAGYALGRFHSLVSDLAPRQLHDTLKGFHVAPRYYRHYLDVLAARGSQPESPEVRHCMAFVEARQGGIGVLEGAKAQGILQLRPIHGDPKINNILIDESSWQAVSMIDLDTVKPGLRLYDIGDCLRSCCNPAGEETDDVDEVRFEIDLCRAILQGYLAVAKAFLDAHDTAHIYDAVRLIAFELGLRFFTDYLEGNVYFKVDHEAENLQKALVQFKLAESIEAQAPQIQAIIRDLP